MIYHFIQYLQTERRLSEHTIIAYQKDIEDFIHFIEITESKELREINSKIIRGWIAHLMQNENKKRTVNRKISTLRTFFKWAEKQNIISKNPMPLIKSIKTEKRLPEFIKEEEINLTQLTPLFSTDFFSTRDRLLLEVFYQTGMRLSELIGLQKKDFQNQTLKVLGKRNKERIIPISKELSQELIDFLNSTQHKEFTNEYIFTTDKGNKLYPKFVYRKINHYLSLITNLKKKSPHVLRHTFATHMLNNGAGLEIIKEILGHANLSATQVYTHNSFEQISKIYKQAHPRGDVF